MVLKVFKLLSWSRSRQVLVNVVLPRVCLPAWLYVIHSSRSTRIHYQISSVLVCYWTIKSDQMSLSDLEKSLFYGNTSYGGPFIFTVGKQLSKTDWYVLNWFRGLVRLYFQRFTHTFDKLKTETAGWTQNKHLSVWFQVQETIH